METENSKRKRKKCKSTNEVQEDVSIGIHDLEKKMYDAANAGSHIELSQTLNILQKRIPQESLEELVFSVFTLLKLNNIALVDDIESILYGYIWKRCFFSTTCSKIKKHIETLDFIVDYVSYFDDENDIVVFSFKVALQGIQLLKHILKSTYDVLPWEEIEFYLLSYITSITERHDLNAFYKIILKKADIIEYLKYFVKYLKELDVGEEEEHSKFPGLTRNVASRKVIELHPVFRRLYQDVDYIRDLYCLHKISEYGKFLEGILPQENHGGELIIRVMSLISEHLKHTLATPNLSPVKSDYLIFYLTETTRKPILALCSTTSCEESLICRRKIKELSNEIFLSTIRQDLIHIGRLSADLLIRNFIELLIRNFSKPKQPLDFLETIDECCSLNFHLMETYFQTLAERNEEFQSNTNRLKKTLNDLASKLPNNYLRHTKLKKIIECKLGPNKQEFEWKKAQDFILKPDFLNYVKPQLSKEDFRDLVNIVLSIQEDPIIKKSGGFEIARLNTEVINLLLLEIDHDDDFNQQLKRDNSILTLLQQKDVDNPFSENQIYNMQSLLSEYKDTLKKVTDKSHLPYSKLNPNTLEIMKSNILDIICISHAQNTEEKNISHTKDYFMLMAYLKSGYELNNLIFNSKMLVYLLARDHEELINTCNSNNLANFKSSFLDQIVALSKKSKARYELENGEFEKFVELLDKGADIHARDVEKSTYLHLSVEKCDIGQIDFLYNKSISLYSKNVQLQTPLHIAVIKGNDEVISYFLDNSKDLVNYPDAHGRTALHIAVLTRQIKITEILINGNSDPFKKDYLGFSSFLYAILDGNKYILKLLVNEENLNRLSKHELQLVIKMVINRNQMEIFDLLISDTSINLDNEIREMMMTSVILNGQIEGLEKMLSRDMVPKNCILIAAQTNYDLIVEKILETKVCDVNTINPKDGMTPLHYAAGKGNVNIINLLLENNANIESRNEAYNTPLHIAVENGHFDAVQTFLDKMTDTSVLSQLNSKRYTPLHIAAEAGYYNIAKLLVDNWVDLDHEDFSIPPLNLARDNGHKDIEELLIENRNRYSGRKNRQKVLKTNDQRNPIPLTKKQVDNASMIIFDIDPEDRKEVLKKITKQNGFGDEIRSKIEILQMTAKGDIILSTEKSVYEQFMKKKQLNIGWNRYQINDYYHIYRCFKCAGFGHDAETCMKEHTCFRCSGNHLTNECGNEDFKCFHCDQKNQELGLDLDTTHSPLYQFCPWYKKLLKDKYAKQKKN